MGSQSASRSVGPDSVTPWTVAHHAPLFMEFSKQESWRGLLFPSPGHLPDPGIEPKSPALQADSSPSQPQGKPKVMEGAIFFPIYFIIIKI